MLTMVALVFFGFLFAVWNSYRRERRRNAEGFTFEPEGKLRWTAADSD